MCSEVRQGCSDSRRSDVNKCEVRQKRSEGEGEIKQRLSKAR